MESRKVGLWKGRLNDDGLVTEMYSYLWLAGEKHPELRRALHIPDTILYERGFPKAWYTWEATNGDEEKTLRKYLGKDIAVDLILKKFCAFARQDVVAKYITIQKKSAHGVPQSKSSASPGEDEEDTAATGPQGTSSPSPTEMNQGGDVDDPAIGKRVPQPQPQPQPTTQSSDSEEKWSLSVQYLTADTLATFLAGRAHGHVGVLQRFVPISAMHNGAFEVCWSPLSAVVTRLRAGAPTSDPVASIAERYATVDADVAHRIRVNVQTHTREKILNAVSLLTQCLASTEGAMVTGISAVLKMDSKGQLVLLYCTSIRSRAADLIVGGRDPLFVGAEYTNEEARSRKRSTNKQSAHCPNPVPPRAHDDMRALPDFAHVRIVSGDSNAASIMVGAVYFGSNRGDSEQQPQPEPGPGGAAPPPPCSSASAPSSPLPSPRGAASASLRGSRRVDEILSERGEEALSRLEALGVGQRPNQPTPQPIHNASSFYPTSDPLRRSPRRHAGGSSGHTHHAHTHLPGSAHMPNDQHSDLRRTLLLFLEDMAYFTRAHRERDISDRRHAGATCAQPRSCEEPYFYDGSEFQFRFPHELSRSIGSSGVQVLMRHLRLRCTCTLYDIHGHSADYYSFPWTATVATQQQLQNAVLAVLPPVIIRHGRRSISRLPDGRRQRSGSAVNPSQVTLDDDDDDDDDYDDYIMDGYPGSDEMMDDEVYRAIASRPEPISTESVPQQPHPSSSASRPAASDATPSFASQKTSVRATPAAQGGSEGGSAVTPIGKSPRSPSHPEQSAGVASEHDVTRRASSTESAVADERGAPADDLLPTASFRPKDSAAPSPVANGGPAALASSTAASAPPFAPPPPLPLVALPVHQVHQVAPSSSSARRPHQPSMAPPTMVVRRTIDWRLESGFPKPKAPTRPAKKRQPLSVEQREMQCTLSPQRKRIYFPEGKRDKPGPSARTWMGMGRRDVTGKDASDPAPLSDAAMQYLQKRNAQQTQSSDPLLTKMPFLAPDTAPRERRPEEIMREFWTQ